MVYNPVVLHLSSKDPGYCFEKFKDDFIRATSDNVNGSMLLYLNSKLIAITSVIGGTMFLFPHLACDKMTIEELWVGINNVRDYALPYKTTILGSELSYESARAIISSGIEVSMVSEYIEVNSEEDYLQLRMML